MIHSRRTHTTLNIETGTNVFNKLEVIAACDRTIRDIKASREEEKEAKVQKYMRPTWLLKRIRSREEALKMMDTGYEYSAFGKIDRHYRTQERIANRVRRIALASVGDTINLTAEEFLEIEPISGDIDEN